MKSISKRLAEKKAMLAVAGLGYVGLPVALGFAKKGLNVIGFDLDKEKIADLKRGVTKLDTAIAEDLIKCNAHIHFTYDPRKIKDASFIIVAVPTPIDEYKNPDLSHLIQASHLIGKNLSEGTIIVYESTVYPGVTEEICIPILEKESGYSWKRKEFFVGYSPERINPGDKEHTLENVVKVVSGQDQETCDEIARVYEIVVKAGIYKAQSIKVAEAAKAIENTQRDLNIALMNELSIIFNRIGVDTEAVLKTAATKWNFLNFHPGLVGGHCIGVDPYYLTSKADQVGYHPHVVLAGRRINDSMGVYIAQQAIKQMIRVGKVVQGANVLVLGVTFKENISDWRNSRVFDIIHELSLYGANVFVYDPIVKEQKIPLKKAVKQIELSKAKELDAIIIATPHNEIKQINLGELKRSCKASKVKPVLIDVRWIFSRKEAERAGFHYWRL